MSNPATLPTPALPGDVKLDAAQRLQAVVPTLDAAKKAVRHTLEQIRNHPHVGWYLGYGTETFNLLTLAAASLFAEPVENVRKYYEPRDPQDPAAEGDGE